jgi:hypothetical protein
VMIKSLFCGVQPSRVLSPTDRRKSNLVIGDVLMLMYNYFVTRSA